MALDDFLSTPRGYATPEQIAALKNYAAILGQSGRGRRAGAPYTWANGLDRLTGALTSALLGRRAGELERQTLGYGASNVPALGDPGSSSSPSAAAAAMGSPASGMRFDTSPPPAAGGSGGPAQSPGGMAPASLGGAQPQNPFLSSPSLGNFSAAADLSARLETGASDPMVGLRNISLDTPDKLGRPSYSLGNYGLNTLPGNPMHDFAARYGRALGLTAAPGTQEFNRQWMRLASNRSDAARLRAAEADWYNKSIAEKIPTGLERAGVPREMAADPRVQAYFADRVIQYGPGKGLEPYRIKMALSSSGGDAAAFIAGMGAIDRTAIRDGRDFKRAHPERREGLLNRTRRREAGALSIGGGAPTAAPAGAAPDKGYEGEPVPGLATPLWLTGHYGARRTEPSGEGLEGATKTALTDPYRTFAPSSYDPMTIGGMLGRIGGGPRPQPDAAALEAQKRLAAAIRGVRTNPPGSPSGGAPGAGAPPPPQPQGAPPPSLPPSSAGRGPSGFIPPVQGLPPLATDQQIRALMSTGHPRDTQFAKELFNAKRAAMQPQQIKDPITGEIYIGNPYTGYRKSGIPGAPEVHKAPLKVGGVETTDLYTLGRGPQGGLVRRRIPMEGAQTPPPAAAPAGTPPPPPTPTGMRPLPSTIEGMADWAAEYGARKKSMETTAQKLGEAKAAPIAAAIKTGEEAQSTINALNIMKDAYAVGEGKISGGPAGEVILNLKNLASQFGVPVSGLSESQIINKMGTQLAFRATRKLSARPALLEVQMQVKANPGLFLNNQASKYMIDLMLQEAKAEQRLGELAGGVADPNDWPALKKKFYAENPLISPFTGKPLNAQKGVGTKELYQAAGQKPPSGAEGAPEKLSPEEVARLPLVGSPAELQQLISEKKLSSGSAFRVKAPDGSERVKRVP